jgi:hypothetical protein
MAVDRNVQLSLHGRKIGLNSAGDLVGNDDIITMADRNRAQRARLVDDFLGTTIPSSWDVQKGSDGAAANFAILAGQPSGLVRATTGAGAGATYAVNGVQLDHGLNWVPNQNGLVFEARVKISAITNAAIFVGLTDQLAALEMPWTLSVTTFTSNQTDGVGFLFDTAATTVTIRLVGVKNDVDAVTVDTSVAFVAATYITLRIEVDVLGNANFFIAGVKVGSIALATTVTIALTPVVAAFARAAASRTVDVDYVIVEQDR